MPPSGMRSPHATDTSQQTGEHQFQSSGHVLLERHVYRLKTINLPYFFPAVWQLARTPRIASAAAKVLGFARSDFLPLVALQSLTPFISALPPIRRPLLSLLSQNFVKLPSMCEFAREVRRLASDQNCNFFSDGLHLLIVKTAFYSQYSWATCFRSPRVHSIQFRNWRRLIVGNLRRPGWTPILVRQVAIRDGETVSRSTRFYKRIAAFAAKERRCGNAYRAIATEEFETSMRSLFKRGLSSILECDNLEEATQIFMRDLEVRGRDRVIPEEEDVMYMALSYRYDVSNGLSADEWENAVRMMATAAKKMGYAKMRIWVDRIAVTRGMQWSSIGFLPFLVFPTFVYTNARHMTNRLWIELEKLAAALGPGILTERSTHDDMLEHLVLCRSPMGSLLALSEVLVSRCLENYEVTYADDRDEMYAWARSLLTTDDVSQILTMPRHDLEGRGEVRHDVSMLCLFDDDLVGCPLVRSWVEHTARLGRSSYDGRWGSVLELLGYQELPNSEEVRSVVENACIVLCATEHGTHMAVCWVVLLTMRGAVITEVGVHHDGDVRTGRVVDCRKMHRSQFSGATFKDWFRERQGELGNDADVQVFSYREIRWT